MLHGRHVADLEQDFQALLAQADDLPRDMVERLRAYERFIRKNSHHLTVDPALLLPLAHAQPCDSPVLAEARQRFDAGPDRPWFRLLFPPETDPNQALLRTLEVGSGTNAVACLTIGGVPYALSGSEDGIVRLWNLRTGRRERELIGHTGAVNGVAVTADGRAVSASGDTTLRVWDLDQGVCRHTLQGHTARVLAVAVTADGRAVSASDDKTLRVWDLDQGVVWSCFRGAIRSRRLPSRRSRIASSLWGTPRARSSSFALKTCHGHEEGDSL